jgi:hypothetical protein
LGTGLNPAHVSGVVSPNDGLVPEMACCGQPFLVERPGGDWVAPPGCWIQLQRGQLYGQPTPYQTWFTQADAAAAAAELWQRIALNGALGTLTGATVTGTAFVNENYYRDLDTQIRKLIDELAPAVFQVYQALLNGGFTQPSGFALLNSKVAQDKLVQLVALVQRYNAPQMGACHHDRSITGDYLDKHVFFISVGRAEFRAGRLITEIDFQGRKVPLVGQATAEAFQKTANALSAGNTLQRNFLTAAKLVTLAVVQQQSLQTRGSEAERVFGSIERGFNSIGLPNVLQSERVKWNSVYQAANQLAQELEKLIGGLPLLANKRLRDDKDVAFVKSLDTATDKLEELRRLLFPGLNTSDEISKWFTVSDEKISAVIAKEPFLNQPDVRNLPQVQRWARAVVVEQNGVPQLGQEIDRLFEIAKVAALQEKVRQEEAAKRMSPAPQEPSGRNVEVSVAPANLPPINSANWDILRSFAYAEESCTYDALFAALFVIPNQWFREVVVNAKRIVRQPQCAESAALSIHRTMIETIKYMEHNLEKPDPFQTVCPNRAIWSSCLPTEANQGRFGNPIILFRNLCGFYDAEYGFAYFETSYGNWNPLYDERRQSELLQIYGIRVQEPPVGQEHTMQGQYAIEQVQGSFTMISCLIYTNGHWQACIRDPRTGIWYRMLDSGYPKELGTDPAEIKSVTTTDPKRPGVKYEPYAWFYVRTERLAQFTAKGAPPSFQSFDVDLIYQKTMVEGRSEIQQLQSVHRAMECMHMYAEEQFDNDKIQRRPKKSGNDYPPPPDCGKLRADYGFLGFLADLLTGEITFNGVLPPLAVLRNLTGPILEQHGLIEKDKNTGYYDWNSIIVPTRSELEIKFANSQSMTTARLFYTTFATFLWSALNKDDPVSNGFFLTYYETLLK